METTLRNEPDRPPVLLVLALFLAQLAIALVLASTGSFTEPAPASAAPNTESARTKTVPNTEPAAPIPNPQPQKATP